MNDITDLTGRLWTDAELLKLPPSGSNDPDAKEGPNPFAVVFSHPVGKQNAARWAGLRPAYCPVDAVEVEHPKTRPALDSIALKLDMKRLGWSRHEHPITGAVAMWPTAPKAAVGSPENAALEAEWEKRSAIMHADQRIIIMDPLAPNGWRLGEHGETSENPAPQKYHEFVKRQGLLRDAEIRKEDEERARAKRGVDPKTTDQPPISKFEDSAQAKARAGSTIIRGD